MGDVRLIQPIFSPENTIHTSAETEVPDGVSMIRSPELWAQGITGKGIVIAVLDTGCFPHPDLAGCVIDGKNFTTEGAPTDYSDGHGHGTHVVGTICAKRNGFGVAGVAPDAQVLVLKVLDSKGSGDYMGIVNALAYARDWTGPNGEKVRVISMSLGGPTDNFLMRAAVRSCVYDGILVVCAAGNDGDDNPETNEVAYPGSYSNVVSVGAADAFGHVAYFSDSNAEVDLVAPGVGVRSTYNDGSYVYMSGTSMATPHVSGAAALIIQQCEQDYGRKLTETEIYAQVIKRTASLSLDKRLEGSGLLNLLEGYAPPLKWEDVTYAQALDIAKNHIPQILDTPQFWLDLQTKYTQGKLTNADFRYMEIAFRKWAAAVRG